MKNIKEQKLNSYLKELVQEAISCLEDIRLNSLSVVEINTSKGKQSAEVFLDKTSLDDKEQKDALKALHKASHFLEQEIIAKSGWFKSPKLTFKFDDSLSNINRLEEIFKKIKAD